eukprot:4198494-Amphidinium_carterae.1
MSPHVLWLTFPTLQFCLKGRRSRATPAGRQGNAAKIPHGAQNDNVSRFRLFPAGARRFEAASHRLTARSDCNSAEYQGVRSKLGNMEHAKDEEKPHPVATALH